MATVTLSLPDPVKEWIEARIHRGEYANASDYVGDLVRRDRVRRGEELTLEELQKLIADSRASSVGKRSLDDIFAEAERIATGRGPVRE